MQRVGMNQHQLNKDELLRISRAISDTTRYALLGKIYFDQHPGGGACGLQARRLAPPGVSVAIGSLLSCMERGGSILHASVEATALR